jgi:L-cysteine S-thiosulfotransferase
VIIFSINFYLILCLFFTSVLFSPFASAEKKVHYKIENYAILKPLTGFKGNKNNGRRLVIDTNKGNCLACHSFPIPEEEFHGTIGPPLQKIALRLNEAQIRLRITDMKKINPNSIMPGYFRAPENINRIALQYENTTLLTAQEIEDVVAYLVTLK